MLLNLSMSLKEAAGRGRLDPWVGATFQDMMKLSARPGIVLALLSNGTIELPEFILTCFSWVTISATKSPKGGASFFVSFESFVANY
jgi:hypothetical protein